ncbi:MAG: hypothetical protein M3068_10325 [Gemmatimonadota bacterium]|nr:hypothetical protein [Gemmatimonadota bacterium]
MSSALVRVLRLASLALGAACVSTPGGGDPGGTLRRRGSGSSREERVLLTAFNDITGVAASRRFIFASTADALGILDRQFNSWLTPVAQGQGFPAGQPSSLAADPVEDAVWILAPGQVLYYRASTNFVTSTLVPGVVDAIFFDRRDPLSGAYLSVGGQLLLASRAGSVTPVSGAMVPPPSARQGPVGLRELYARFPSLQNFAALYTRDEQMQSWPISAGAEPPDNLSEVWLGTRGGGLFKVDPNFHQSQHYPYGLLETGAGALALAADGIWVAGLGRGYGRGGISFASADLQQWRWLEGPLTRPLAGARAYRMDVRADAAWIASDRGAVRMDTRNPNNVRSWSGTNGLPADLALSVVATPAGAWVGTGRGLVFIADDGRSRGGAPRGAVSQALAEGTAVRALLLTGDTLWIGSDAGLLLLRGTAADSQPRRAAAAAQEPRLLRAIRGISRSDSEVVVATQEDLLRFNLRSGELLPRYDAVRLSAVGAISSIAVDPRTIWVAGPGGVLMIHRDTGVSRFLSVPADVPAEAYDIKLDDDFAWIATRLGVLRLRRASDGTIP